MGPRIPWNVSCNRKCSEWALTYTLSGVWLRINACACVFVCARVCMPAGCFYSAQVVVLLFPPVHLLFLPYSTILVFVMDKKETPQQGPLPEHCLPPDIFQSSPATHTLPLSHLKIPSLKWSFASMIVTKRIPKACYTTLTMWQWKTKGKKWVTCDLTTNCKIHYSATLL